MKVTFLHGFWRQSQLHRKDPYVKEQVYASPLPNSVQDLQERICLAMECFGADALHRACEGFTYHSEVVSVI
jgi:hypothetical protein